MGLTMYLYRAKKKLVDELNRLKEAEENLDKMIGKGVLNES